MIKYGNRLNRGTMNRPVVYLMILTMLLSGISGLVITSEVYAQEQTEPERLRPVEVEPPEPAPRRSQSRSAQPDQGFGYSQPIPSGVPFSDYELTSGEVVSPTRGPANLATVHSSVSVVENKGIGSFGHAGIADMLQGLPGLYVSGFSGNNFDQSIVMRGYSEPSVNYVSMMLDGVKTTIPRQELNSNFVFPERIERIEVIRGDSTVAFGNKSIGGAVNVILKKPRQHPGSHFGAEGGSWGTERQWASINLIRGPLAAGIFIGRYRQEGWRVYYGNGLDEEFVPRPGPWSLMNVSGSINWKMTPWLTLDITNHTSDTRKVQGDRLPWAEYQRGDIRDIGASTLNLYDDGPDEGWDSMWIGKMQFQRGNLGTLELLGSRRLYDRRVQLYAYLGSRMSDQRWEEITRQAKYERADEWAFVNNSLTTGIDWQDGKFGRESRAAVGRPNFRQFQLIHDGEQSGYRESVSYYAINRTTFWKHLVLGLGYRLESVDLKDLYANNAARVVTNAQRLKYEKSANEYSFGLIYDLDLGSNVYYKHSRTYRIPNFDDMINFGGAGAPPDPPFWRLSPDEGTLEEYGIRHWFNSRCYFGAVAYNMHMDNEIFFGNDELGRFRNLNVPNVSHEGVELEMLWKMTPRWTVKGNYTRQRVLVMSDFQPQLPASTEDTERYQTPNEMYNLDLSYNNTDYGFSAMASWHYVGSRYVINDFFNNRPALEGAHWGDLTFSQSMFGEMAQLYGGVKNFTDQKYALLGTSSNMTQRTFYWPNAGITYYFGVRAGLDFDRMRMPTTNDLNRLGQRLQGGFRQAATNVSRMGNWLRGAAGR